MTTGTPSEGQIRAQVEHLLKRDPDANVIGLRAGMPGAWPTRLQVDGRTFCLKWCQSPLALRQLLAADPVPAEGAEGIVVLTPLPDDALGADLLSRFARGRLLAVDSWEMLCVAFQARHVDFRLRRREWIADLLLERAPPGGYPPVGGGVLDADTAWRHLLDRALGLAEARPDAERLLEWTIQEGAVDRFTSLPDKGKQEVAAWLSSVSGAAGALIVSCLTHGHGLEALPLGLVCGVIFSERWTEPDLAAAAIRLESFVGRHKVDVGAGRQWAEAATSLVRKGSHASFRRWLDHADRLLQQAHACEYAGLSPVLPSGFEARLVAQAEAVRRALAEPSDEAMEAVERNTKAVLCHHMASQEPARRRRAEMAARLLRWMRVEPKPFQSFEEAAKSYAGDGGYVDWARRAMAGGDENARVSEAYGALAERVRKRREDENRAFAQLLRSWNTAPAAGSVVPVENVLAGVVAPLARQSVPVVLLVVDGLSFSVFRELSGRLGELGWIELMPATTHEALAAIAALPTITDVSRTSLLSGALASGNAQTEKPGFAAHPDLVSASTRGKPPVLFHKGDLGDAAGLAPEVREALADPGQRIVGIVHNAIDDYLDGPDQLHVSWSIDDIRALRPLLREAFDAGRALILTSDHGHVLEDGTSFRAASEGDRWRSPSGSASDDEVEIGGGRVLTPAGQRIAIMPWSERVRYGSKKNGYHGGVALQEVVIPLCVLSPGRTVEGWIEAAPSQPAWWHEGVAARPVPGPWRPQSSKGTLPPSADLPLFREAAKPHAAADDWIAALFSSSAYRDQKRLAARAAPSDEALRTVLVALQPRGGKLSKTALAHNAGVPLLRLPGLLSAAKRVLNIDQSAILRIDEPADTVELNIDLLIQQFGLGSRR